MSPRKIARVLLVSASAMVVAIIFTKTSSLSMEGAVGVSALLVAISYEITDWQKK